MAEILGVVAWEIAKGALNEGGSKILDGILRTRPDPVKLQADSIAQISLALEKVLDSALLDAASSKLKSLMNSLTEYNNAPATSLFRLYDATTDSLDLLSTLASLKDAGIPAYLVAAGMRITILQDLYTAKGDNGELLNILIHIKRSMTQCGEPIAEKKEILNRAMKWTAVPLNITGPQGQGGTLWFWQWPLGGWGGGGVGGQLNSAATKEEAEKMTKKAAQDWYQKEVAPIADPYEKVSVEWLAIRQRTVEQAKAAGIDVPKELQ
jgi:hypothetical protein